MARNPQHANLRRLIRAVGQIVATSGPDTPPSLGDLAELASAFRSWECPECHGRGWVDTSAVMADDCPVCTTTRLVDDPLAFGGLREIGDTPAARLAYAALHRLLPPASTQYDLRSCPKCGGLPTSGRCALCGEPIPQAKP